MMSKRRENFKGRQSVNQNQNRTNNAKKMCKYQKEKCIWLVHDTNDKKALKKIELFN